MTEKSLARFGLEQRIHAVEACEREDFASLIKAAKLDPATAFRFARLKYQNFNGCDLSGFDFTGADLVGSTFAGALLQGACFRGALFSADDLRRAKDWAEQRARIMDEALESPQPASSSLQSAPISRVLIFDEDPLRCEALARILRQSQLEVVRLSDKSARWDELIGPGDAIVEVIQGAGRLDPSDGPLLAVTPRLSFLVVPKAEPAPHTRATRASLHELFVINDIERLNALAISAVREFAERLRGRTSKVHTWSPRRNEEDVLYPLGLKPRTTEQDIADYHREAERWGVDAGRVAKLESLIKSREAASRQGGWRRAQLASLAEEFAAWRRSYVEGLPAAEARRAKISLKAVLEEVVCRLDTRVPSQAQRALASLVPLAGVFRHYPMFWFRKAQALAASFELLGEPAREDFIQELEIALSAAWEAALIQSARPQHERMASEAELQFLKHRIPRIHAHLLWSEALGGTSTASIDGLKRAARLSFQAIRNANKAVTFGIVENAIIYGIAALQNDRSTDAADDGMGDIRVDLVGAIDALMTFQANKRPLEILHLVMTARHVLGDVAAEELAFEYLARCYYMESDDVITGVSQALSVLRKYRSVRSVPV